jgi:hypothetical protein
VAVDGSDGQVATSTDPAAGGSSWRVVTIDSVGLAGVSCPSVHLCVAVDGEGRVLTTRRPGA